MTIRLSPLLLLLTILFVFSGCETLDIPKSTTERTKKPSSWSLTSHGLHRTGKSYTGKASWYSVHTNGGTTTASGERLQNNGMTAAHRSLPFGTMVEVTSLLDNKSVILRITDRGPYVHGRIIDVSIGAARKMGWVGHGVIPVRVTVMKRIGSSGNPRHKPDRKSTQQLPNSFEVFGLN